MRATITSIVICVITFLFVNCSGSKKEEVSDIGNNTGATHETNPVFKRN